MAIDFAEIEVFVFRFRAFALPYSDLIAVEPAVPRPCMMRFVVVRKLAHNAAELCSKFVEND